MCAAGLRAVFVYPPGVGPRLGPQEQPVPQWLRRLRRRLSPLLLRLLRLLPLRWARLRAQLYHTRQPVALLLSLALLLPGCLQGRRLPLPRVRLRRACL